MLPETAASKVTATHLSRRALLYIRQSSLKQVIHNTESAIRQYDLRGKAISLGWHADRRMHPQPPRVGLAHPGPQVDRDHVRRQPGKGRVIERAGSTYSCRSRTARASAAWRSKRVHSRAAYSADTNITTAAACPP